MRSSSIIEAKRQLLKLRRRAIVTLACIVAIICAFVFARPIIQDQPDSDIVFAKTSTTTLFFAGDIMLARGVDSKISESGSG